MANPNHNGRDADERERYLLQEIAKLKEQLRATEADRDFLQAAVKTWALQQFTEEELKQWECNDDRGDGRTILDVLAEVRGTAN